MFIAPVIIVLDNLGVPASDQGTLLSSHAAQELIRSPITPLHQYFAWPDQHTSPNNTLPVRKLLYVEKLSPSSISVLGPLLPIPGELRTSQLLSRWGSRPSQLEPFFLGCYESLSCFSDLIWQLCSWTMFMTYTILFGGFHQPTFLSYSPILNAYSQAVWILCFQPSGAVISIIFLASRWLDRRSRNRKGILLRIVTTLGFIAAPVMTSFAENTLGGILVYAAIIIVYILLCAILVFLLVGNEDLKGWKRLSDEAELP